MTNSLSSQKKLLLLTLLTSVTTLTACGQKEAQAVPSSKASAAAKVIGKSSSTAAMVAISATTNATEVQSQAETAETNSEGVIEQETSPETEKQATPVNTSLDVNALSSGDYRSITGTWANAKGEVFTVSSDGKMTVQRTGGDSFTVHMKASGITETGYVYGGVGSYYGDVFWSNSVVAIVPAGVANVLGEVGERDHIEIGQGTHAANPEEQYFRQSSQ